MRASNVLGALDGSFSAGLLEAVAQVAADGEPCLLICCDVDYPEPLRHFRPLPAPFGVALLITPQQTSRSLGAISLAPGPAPATAMADPALEALRHTAPAARALPLLQALSGNAAQTVVLDYLDDLQLAVTVEPGHA
jgi:hypothetical protein